MDFDDIVDSVGMQIAKELEERFPKYEFKITPPVYIEEAFKVMRGIFVRQDEGEWKKLHFTWNIEQKQDARAMGIQDKLTEEWFSKIDEELSQL